jgi:hypothetical protein
LKRIYSPSPELELQLCHILSGILPRHAINIDDIALQDIPMLVISNKQATPIRNDPKRIESSRHKKTRTSRGLIKAQQYRRRARYRRNPKQLQIIKNNRLVWYYDKTLHGDALKTEL